MKAWIIGCLLLVGGTAYGQRVNVDALKPEKEYENVLPHLLFSDSNATSVLLWIKGGVMPHYHATHSEHVVVLSGKGLMRLGEDLLKIRKGDVIFIPQGTAHSVEVKSKVLKVISIQAPEFDGSDRIMIK